MLNPHDPFAPILFGVTLILVAALLSRVLCRKLEFPTLVGELLIGIILGCGLSALGYEFISVLHGWGPNASLAALATTGTHGEPGVATGVSLADFHVDEYWKVFLAHGFFFEFGILFLLFHLGLSANLDRLRNVSRESVSVALVGVFSPFALGFLAVWLVVPDVSVVEQLFIGATLAATGVGVTDRAFRRIGHENSRHAQIVLGAALLDDAAVLVVMVFAMTIMASDVVSLDQFVRVSLVAFIFLSLVVALGPWVSARLATLLHLVDVMEAKLFVSLIFALGLAWFANLIGISPLFGAFAAGMLLDKNADVQLRGTEAPYVSIRELLAPLEAILVPVFFVMIGIQVHLEVLAEPGVIVAAVTILLVAFLGKMVSGLAARPESGRMLVGIGMLPRGEVGVVFAAVGHALGVLNSAVFSILVLMVILTTLLAPLMLRMTCRAREK